MDNNSPAQPVARIKIDCDCGCEAPVATEPIGMLQFLARRMELAGVSGAVCQVYAHDIRKILAAIEKIRPASELTDKELSDPGYMRAYVDGCNETTMMFAERARALQTQLNAYQRPAAPTPPKPNSD